MVIQIKSLIINNTQEELFENLLDFLDGKTTVYHGTSPENKINIQQNGLKALGSGIIGYNLLKDEPTKADQFIDTIYDIR